MMKFKIPDHYPEDFIWIVETDDGKIYPQFDENGSEVGFGTIDPIHIRKITLRQVLYSDMGNILGAMKITKIFNGETTPVLVRRHRFKINGEQDSTVFVLGDDSSGYLFITGGGEVVWCAEFEYM